MPENGVRKPARQPEETEISRSEPVLCHNRCGFYGSPERRNLCSKCFRDALEAERAAQSEQKSDEVDLSPSTASTSQNRDTTSTALGGVEDEASVSTTLSHVAKPQVKIIEADAIAASDPDFAKKSVKKNRCGVCRRKLRLAQQFSCRCDLNFCATHRYPDSHDCEFDFKAHNQQQLSKANPVVIASKVNKI